MVGVEHRVVCVQRTARLVLMISIPGHYQAADLGVFHDEGGVNAGLLQEVAHQLVQQPRGGPGGGTLALGTGKSQEACSIFLEKSCRKF